MGITLTQYRISVGYFNRCKYGITGLRVRCRSATINVVFVLVILILLLILGGDVELNPGPPSVVCKHLNICHVNIRSLSRAKLLAIQASLANVYDIITISETHLHQGVGNDLFELKGYHEILRKDRGGNGGGIAMYKKLFHTNVFIIMKCPI
jgi:hypothetical protein